MLVIRVDAVGQNRYTPLCVVGLLRFVPIAPGLPVRHIPLGMLVFLIAIAIGPTVSWAFPQAVVDLSLHDSQGTRWLMLRNGTVFSGQITAQNSKYTIQIDSKTQMTYDPGRVWVIADSLGEIYEFYRARLQPGDLNGQLEFARWCVSQKLWAEAEQEIETLRLAGVPDAQLRGMALTVQRAIAGPVAAPTFVMPKPKTPAPRDELRPVPPTSRASHVPAPSPQTLPAVDDKPKPIVNSVFSFYDQPGFENDARVQEAIDGSVQQEAVTQFNETVHWAVVQACAGCHYPENEKLALASSFSLDIPSAKHKATLTQSRHNLDQLLTLINRENPGNSRLLSLLSQPHGPLKEPPITVDSDDFRAIQQWIYRSGIVDAGREPETRVVPANAESIDAEPTPVPATAESLQLPRLLPGSLGPEIDPARPYDPAAFNRLYHPQGPPPNRSNDGQPPTPGLPLLPEAPPAKSLADRSPTNTALAPLGSPDWNSPSGMNTANAVNDASTTNSANGANARMMTPEGLPRVRRPVAPPQATGPTHLRPRQ